MATLYEHYNENDDNITATFGVDWKAQTFTVGNVGDNVEFIIVGLKVMGTKVGSPGNIAFEIRAVDGAGAPLLPVLATGTYNGNSFPAYPTRGWSTEFAITHCVLEPDTQYAIVASVASGNASNYFGWGHDRTSPAYGGGYIWSSGESGADDTWAGNSGIDFMFEVYGALSLSGTVVGSSNVPSAELKAIEGLGGTIAAETTLAGNLKSEETLGGLIETQSALTGNINTTESLAGLITSQSSAEGNLFYIEALAGIIAAQSSLTGYLQLCYGHIPPEMHKDLIDPYASGAWLQLVKIVVPGYDAVKLARNTKDVVYGEQNFEKFNLQIGEQTFSSDGSIPRVTLRIFQDVNRKVEDIINATEGALGAAVKLIRVNEKWLDIPVIALEADYDNLASESDSEWVTFTIGIPNPLTQRFPLRNYSSSMCPWAHPDLFKGPDCQYPGEDTSCLGTYEACYTKGNAVHWGAELGLDPSVAKGRK